MFHPRIAAYFCSSLIITSSLLCSWFPLSHTGSNLTLFFTGSIAPDNTVVYSVYLVLYGYTRNRYKFIVFP